MVQARMSPARIESILTVVRRVKEGQSLTIKQFQRLLGLMSAASNVIPIGLQYMRPLIIVAAAVWLVPDNLVSRFRVPSRLPLLSLLQLVVWAISANRAAALHGSRADAPPPVTHSPSPIYVSMFLLLVVSRLFCPRTECSLPVPLFPCATELTAQRSSSSCGPQTLPAGSGITAS